METQAVTKLITLLEESTRASPDIVSYFLEPAPGVLSRAMSKRHHIIFGRRGSGKSSLLRKAVSDLTVNRIPIGYVDLEQFKGHSYPDVLVSILIKTFQEFKSWLDTAAINPASKKSFWQKLFGAVPNKPAFNKSSTKALAEQVSNVISDLNRLLLESDEISRTATERDGSKNAAEATTSVGGGAVPTKIGGKFSAVGERSSEIQSEYSHKKIEVLHRKILEYKDLFKKISELAGGATYLLLDDLYFIKKADQAQVVDYFHRIAKGSELWLKVGTIRNRSSYYRFGDPPIGMKLGDDADEIDLDITLEKFNSTKKFLLTILDNFAKACDVDIREILTDGAKDRLILASGGVARDFLTIFRRAIAVARERLAGDTSRGGKVGAEDVNVAAGNLDDFKREDFQRDTESEHDQNLIISSFNAIKEFCLKTAQANCFLIEKDFNSKQTELVSNLVDLKFLHRAQSRVTVRNRTGRLYDAYMLDISQYTGSRAIRNFDIIDFWGKDSDDALRKPAFIYAEEATLLTPSASP